MCFWGIIAHEKLDHRGIEMEVPQQVSHRVMSFLNCPIGLFGRYWVTEPPSGAEHFSTLLAFQPCLQ